MSTSMQREKQINWMLMTEQYWNYFYALVIRCIGYKKRVLGTFWPRARVFHWNCIPIDKVVQREHVPIEEGSDPDDSFRVQRGSTGVTFSASPMQRSFDTDVETALPDPQSTEIPKELCKIVVSLLRSQNTAEKSRKAPVEQDDKTPWYHRG